MCYCVGIQVLHSSFLPFFEKSVSPPSIRNALDVFWKSSALALKSSLTRTNKKKGNWKWLILGKGFSPCNTMHVCKRMFREWLCRGNVRRLLTFLPSLVRISRCGWPISVDHYWSDVPVVLHNCLLGRSAQQRDPFEKQPLNALRLHVMTFQA